VRNRYSHLIGAKGRCLAVGVTLCIALFAAAARCQDDAIPDRLLTNRDVIEMVQSGLSPRAVILRIHDSPCKFDKSSEGLEALRTANVPYKVVLAMMQAPEVPPAVKGRIPMDVPDSTPVKVALSESLDSETNKPGYVIYFKVLEDVRFRGLRVVAKGARARGRLLDSRDRSHLGEAAKLEWTMMDVEAVDGQRLPLRGGSEVAGTEIGQEKTVGVGKGEEFTAYIYGLRKVNVPAPILP
jgi:hypothetical protein